MNKYSVSKHVEPLINQTLPNESPVPAPVSREGEKWRVESEGIGYKIMQGDKEVTRLIGPKPYVEKVTDAHNASLSSGTKGEKERLLRFIPEYVYDTIIKQEGDPMLLANHIQCLVDECLGPQNSDKPPHEN